MHYVMADLHGRYERYLKMLETIQFSEKDVLYVLGDVVDRGSRPISILLDMCRRPNVVFLSGNHELMARSCMGFLLQDMEEEAALEMLSRPAVHRLMEWEFNGGDSTIAELRRTDRAVRRQVKEYLDSAALFAEVKIRDRTYIMVHSGFANFSPERALSDYGPMEVLWERPDYDVPYFTDERYVITGHTPTQLIEGNPRPGYIFRKNHHIVIDCGCALEEGRLGCLRLEDEQEFYVE